VTVHFPETELAKTLFMAVPQTPKSFHLAGREGDYQVSIRCFRPDLTIRLVFYIFPKFLESAVHIGIEATIFHKPHRNSTAPVSVKCKTFSPQSGNILVTTNAVRGGITGPVAVPAAGIFDCDLIS
jgi:hypothetical protein